MKSGKWLLAAMLFFVLAIASAPERSLAAGKDNGSSIYNKTSKKGKSGPISFSGNRDTSNRHGATTDELPFSERNAQQKAALQEAIEEAAILRAEHTKRMVDQIQAENDMRMAQQSQHVKNTRAMPQGGNKAYVYTPSDSNHQDETPNIVITPKDNSEQNDGGPFRVFKFNRNK